MLEAAVLSFPQGQEIDPDELARIQNMAEQGGEDILTEDEAAVLYAAQDQKGDPSEHGANLAEFLDEGTLGVIAQDVIQWYDWDEQSRADWKEREAKGIKKLGVSENTEGGASFAGAAKTVHPLLAEACVQFQARAIAELWPAGGPVKTVVLGESTPERDEQAARVQGYMNYQYTKLMPGAFTEEDLLLFRLPFSGSVFVKPHYDPLLEKVVRRFIDPNYFVVPYTATDLPTAPRYTHVILESTNTAKKKMAAGYYRQVDLLQPYEDTDDSGSTQAVRDEIDAAEGRERVSMSNDQRHTMLEMHVDYDIPGLEDVDENGEPTGIALPYIITVEKDQWRVLSIRRNWREGDRKKQKRVYFTHRRFLPGLGFYGYGFIHIIGGLGDAATGALRALLDSAHFNNLPGGFRSKDAKLPNGDVTIGPGEWVEVECTAEDLNKTFFKIPYGSPSEALFKLLGLLTEFGQRFASTTEAMVGEAANTGPVGTTLALIEQGMKLFSAIHKRQHEALGEEFAIVAELNAEYLPAEGYPYDVPGESREIFAADFDDRIDVEPVSDPNIVTSTQRIAQAQAEIQLANENPDLYDRRAVHKRFLEALRVPNIDEIMPDRTQVPHMGPVEENVHMLSSQPVKAYPDQDHQAHMIVHQGWFAGLDPETQKRMAPMFYAHQAEHMATMYLLQMQQAVGQQIPMTAGEDGQAQPLPPQIENQFAMMAAQAVQLMAQQPQAPDPQVEAMAADQAREDAIAQADIDRKDAIAAADIHRKDITAMSDIARQVQDDIARINGEAEARGYQ